MRGLSFIFCLVFFLSSVVFAQTQIGLGHSDLRLQSSIGNSGLINSSARILQSGSTLNFDVSSSNITHEGLPVGFVIDTRPTRDANILSLPGEAPGTLGVGPGAQFLIDPVVSPILLRAGVASFNFTVPQIASGAINHSTWIQSILVTFSGVRFSNALRFDHFPTLQRTHLSSPVSGAQQNFGDAIISHDMNQDGVLDLVIGESRANLGGVLAGAVHVIYGPDFTSVATIASPNLQANSDFGRDIAVGDFTGDGELDLAIGARAEAHRNVAGLQLTNAGAAYIVSNWNSPSPSYIQLKEPSSFGGAEASAWFGQKVVALDWNADGVSDLLVTARKGMVNGQAEAGEAFLYLGPFRNGAAQSILHLTNSNSSITPQFGYGAASGDFNGDGLDDVAIGQYRYDQNPSQNDDTGSVVVFLSPQTTSAMVVTIPEDRAAYLGHEIRVSDLDNDGIDDLIIGAEFADDAAYNAGSVLLAYGPDFLSRRRTLVSPNPQPGLQQSMFGPQSLGGAFGSDVDSCDVNGDGLSDIVVGEMYANTSGVTRAGRSWIFLGPEFDTSFELTPQYPARNSYAGRRVHCMASPSDGFGKALSGAPFHRSNSVLGLQDRAGLVELFEY